MKEHEKTESRPRPAIEIEGWNSPGSSISPRSPHRTRSMESLPEWRANSLMEGAHAAAELGTPRSVGTPTSDGSSPGLHPSQPPSTVGGLQLSRSATEDMLRSSARPFGDALASSLSTGRRGGGELLSNIQATEASILIAKVRTDHEVEAVLAEIRAQKPDTEQGRALLKSLEDQCKRILNLGAEDMDRNQFYAVVGTLQSLVSQATHISPVYKQLASKALFTTSRCSRLLQYMDLKDTALSLSSSMQHPPPPPARRGSMPMEMGRNSMFEMFPCSRTGTEDSASESWESRIASTASSSHDTVAAPFLRQSFDAGMSNRHSLDMIAHQSFDDLQALRNLMENIRDRKAEGEEQPMPASRPMQCHICDRYVKREHYEKHSDMCVEMCQIADALKNCDFLILHSEQKRIEFLLGDQQLSPSGMRRRRPSGSGQQLTDVGEYDRLSKAKDDVTALDRKILEQLRRVVEDAQVVEHAKELAGLSARLDQLVNQAAQDSAVSDIVAEFLPRISNTIQEKRRSLMKLDEMRLPYDASFADSDDDGVRSRGGSTHRDGVGSSQEKKVSIKDFNVIKHVSHGAYGAVFLARKKHTGDYFAIKKLKKDHMVRKKQVEHVIRERNIMATTNNPFLVKLFYSFQSKENLYFVMEFCQGGDLASLLENLGGFEEDMVRGYVGEMVLALEYLRSQMIVHRDLKPDNILVASDGHIRLTDFGLSYGALVEHLLEDSLALFDEMAGRGKAPGGDTAIDQGKKRYSEVGTPHYLAPEILTGIGHSYPVDFWALGVMMYEFFVGAPPFNGPDLATIFQRITCCDIEWYEEVHVPDEAKDLICALLTIDPEHRLGTGPSGFDDVKQHSFFRDVDWSTLLDRPAVFVPQPDNEMDTGYFVEKSDDEGVAHWSCDSGSESDPLDELAMFRDRDSGGSPDDDEVQFLGFSFRHLDHLKDLNMHQISKERRISEEGGSPHSGRKSDRSEDREDIL